jgi:hypothetical protein
MCHLRIFLETLVTRKRKSEDIRSPGRDLNPRPPECKADMLIMQRDILCVS